MTLYVSKDLVHYSIITSLSALLAALFLAVNYKHGEYCFQTLAPHGEVAYNVAVHNSLKINEDRLNFVIDKQVKSGMYVDYADIDHACYGGPNSFRDVGDTPFYGVVIGLLWKYTHSLRYIDVQFLQIILFIIFLLMLYSTLRRYSFKEFPALIMVLSVLFFLPLLFQNTQPHRDIWAFYGSIILFDFLISVVMGASYRRLSFMAIIFAIIQLVRPTLFFLMVVAVLYLVLYAGIKKQMRLLAACALLCVINGVVFWVPLISYNKQAYGRIFVGPIGQDFLEGLGEYENQWGYQLNDRWYADYMTQHYPHITGRQERDDKAKELFNQALKENPSFYIKSLIKRFCAMLLPNFAWSVYPESLYAGLYSVSQKIRAAIHSPTLLLDLLLRLLVVRLMLLLGYVGLFLMLRRKEYELLGILVVIWLGSFAKFFSHIELRYLVSFYWPLAIAVGYLVCHVAMLKKDKKQLSPFNFLNNATH